MHEQEKRIAGEAAVEEIAPGMLVGLGTGSTAAFAIAALGRKVADGLDIRAVATSRASERAAREAGIAVIAFDDVAIVDLTIDGADEIDDRLRAIKGAGGAMLREKIVAAASRRMIVVADSSKRCAAIGRVPVPVEILPFARAFVLEALGKIADGATLRMRDGAPWRTDQGNLIADCAFTDLPDPTLIAARIDAIPGALGHGLFLHEADAAYIGDGDRVIRIERNCII